ncbi:MAG: polyamine ABC transporter substrate-binding protein [Phenylobacterium sp.]|jgi:putrescine transport system substrate-binding protein|nr:polyamine ABC transporter substrate-binding protein [Phenylobacterium sp.]
MRAWVKKTGLAAASAAALLGLAACGQGQSANDTVRIYNWSDYIDPELLEAFTSDTGLKIVYDTFDSNEVLETKMLQGGTGYDVVTPSNHNIPRYIEAGAIAELDKSKLTNIGNLSPKIMAYMEPFDPGGRYTVPYMWGTIGIGFNPQKVAERLPGVTIDSWDVLFKPENMAKLADCGVHFLDASEDMYAVALNYLGKDPNSTTVADYEAATEMLMAVRPHVRKFHSSEYVNGLANGDICVAIGYSGDIFQAADRASEAGAGVEVDYVIPSEGSQVWFDVFAIPVDAPNPDAAYAFLDFMLRPDVIATASNYTAYANANEPATALIDPEVRDDPRIYPSDEVMERLFVTTAKGQDLVREVNRLWTRVQTGQ